MRRLGTLLKDSFIVFTEHLALFAIIILAVHCILLSIGIFWHPQVILPEGARSVSAMLSPDLVLWLSINFVLTLFCNLAILIAIHNITQGDAILWTTAYREAYARFLPYCLTMFLSFMIILLGLFAFIIPGLVLIGLFIFTPFCVVVDGYSGFSALGHSMRLINKNKSKILGNITVIILIVFAVNASAYIFGALMQSVWIIKVVQFAMKVFSVWPTIFIMMLYKDAMEAMESGDGPQAYSTIEG